MRLANFFLSVSILPLLVYASTKEQIAMDSPQYVPQTTPKPTLSDLLTIEPSVSIFYSYARELELSARFSDKDEKLSIFAPINKAVIALPRKPHQGPDHMDDGIIVSEEVSDMRSKNFVRKWVASHIVPEKPFDFSEPRHLTLARNHLSVKPISKSSGDSPDWGKVVIQDSSSTGIHIVGKREGLNGDLYLVDGTFDAWVADAPIAHDVKPCYGG